MTNLRPDHFGPWDHRGLTKRFTITTLADGTYQIWDGKAEAGKPRKGLSLALSRLDELNADHEAKQEASHANR